MRTPSLFASTPVVRQDLSKIPKVVFISIIFQVILGFMAYTEGLININ